MSCVTLDDFGLNKQVNKEIYKWTKKNKVCLVSLLVNAPFTKDALSIYKKDKKRKYKLGLHFNIVEGKPLCNKEDISSLISNTGFFYPLPVFMIRLFFGLIKKADVMKELKMQHGFFVRKRIICAHINSHQNIHVFHFMYSCIDEFAKLNNIKKIRQISTVKNRLRKFPIKYLVFTFLYFISSHLFSSYTHKPTLFFENTFHPGTRYDI